MSDVASTCGTCGEVGIVGSRFCEACGATFAAAGAPGIAAPENAVAPCVDCGATGDQIDADRYCMVCGRRQPATSDHQELQLPMVVAVTDRGKVHHRNEDAFAASVATPLGAAADSNPDIVVVMVCDGVSSTADSDQAAALATQAGCADALAAIEAGESVIGAAQRAMLAAQVAAASVPASVGQSASCTAVLFLASKRGRANWDAVVAWAGDSRAYLEADGAMTRLTDDHAWAAEQIRGGSDPASAWDDSRAHSITRWLGADAPETDVAIKPVAIDGGERVFVVSDGLWKYVPEAAQMANAVAQRAPTSTLAEVRALVEFANECGGNDNITVAVATF